MVRDLFPRAHARHAVVPIFGSTDGFAAWLDAQGYRRSTVRGHLRALGRLTRALCRQGHRSWGEQTGEALDRYAGAHAAADPQAAATARALARYLGDAGPASSTPLAPPLASYREYLATVRGLTHSTIATHVATITELLESLDYTKRPTRLRTLGAGDLETFLQTLGARVGRATLQHAVAHLRSFLRFLAAHGEIAPGLDAQLDTPRVYRLEQLPRALPWPTVQAFLRAIDRTTPGGRRDYAMFLLVTTYGLRASEVVGLRLDDIAWRAGELSIVQGKTDTPLLLPLMREAGEALLDYLRYGRPASMSRAVFLRLRAPAGTLKPTALCEAFQAWVRRSGLPIPFHGPHCLRHSYAVHLLRQGTALKTIGDVLGHRSAEATCAYLRLAVDDLRDVALELPLTAVPGGRP